MSYPTASRRYLAQRPKVVNHSRDSSTESRSSSSTSTTHRSSMVYGYGGSSQSRVSEEVPVERVHRAPDSENFRATSKTSRSGGIEVTQHNAKAYRPDEPRASNATYEDYKKTSEHRSNKSSKSTQ